MEISSLKEKYKNIFGNKNLYLVKVPLRISPLGAHIDHQNGIVSGITVNKYIYLLFSENKRKIRIYSENYKDMVEFSIDENQKKGNHWGDYIKGAFSVLKEKYEIEKGIDGLIYGEISTRGLSSSAATGISYLLTLEKINNLKVSEEENVFFMQKIENDFIGLNNGILDQSIILLNSNSPLSLLFIDCKTNEFKNIIPEKKIDFDIIIVHSGVDRVLIKTNYNERVKECIEASKILLKLAGEKVKENVRLRNVKREYFETYKSKLPENLRKRAEHFYSEMERIEKGIGCWEKGNIEKFGKLMKESGESSIKNYECGILQTIEIHKILNSMNEVYGARFSGAGFGGSCIGFVKKDCDKEKLSKTIEEEYLKKFPSLKEKFEVIFTHHGNSPSLSEIE